MIRARLALVIALSALALSCRGERSGPSARKVDLPISSPSAIPDAKVSGTLRGTPFVVRDARYVIDRRVGYAHTDIKLSAGTSETPCGPITNAHAPSVWLRLDGDAKIASQDLRISVDEPGPWTLHYQVFEDEKWVGVTDGTALLALREPGPDGRLQGGLAVCFPDDPKSCVSGSFDAVSCPPSIDQPVRGASPPESIPEKYRLKLLTTDAGTRGP